MQRYKAENNKVDSNYEVEVSELQGWNTVFHNEHETRCGIARNLTKVSKLQKSEELLYDPGFNIMLNFMKKIKKTFFVFLISIF